MRLILKREELIAYTILILFALGDIIMYYNSSWYYDAGYKMSTPYAARAHSVALIAMILILVTVFIRIYSFTIFNFREQIALYILFGAAAIWSAISIVEGAQISNLLVRSYSPMLLLFTSVVVLGADENIYEGINRLALILCLVMACLTLYHESQLLFQYGVVRSKSSAIYPYLVNSICLWTFGSFNSSYWKNRTLKIVELCMVVVGCFLTMSRGYTLIGIILIYLFYCYGNSENEHATPFSTHIKFALTMIVLFALAQYVFPTYFSELLGRLNADTRSGQYIDFFSQVSLSQLILGQGMNASYSFSRFSSYSYIDNAFLVMVFRYGIIQMIAIMYLTFRSIYLCWKRRINGSWQLIFVWLLMSSGCSVYMEYNMGIPYLLVWISVGKILSNNYETDDCEINNLDS